MNVDRMRRYAAAAREAADRREWQTWIAGHEHTRPVCSTCLNRALSRGLASMGAEVER